LEDGVLKINRIVEKPGVGMIDSDYAIIGGAVYDPEMFNAIEESMRRLENENTPRELVYVDAVNILLERQKQCLAAEIKGGIFRDCGSKLEYLKTVVEYGLKHDELKEEFGKYLKNIKV
jgi:UTP--glucose-1-phosphate uridylyltransferase